ncbi:MAG: glycosyltransferase [Chthoniobacteraceae bacterium]|nr:glycosyltransferase [Chthoniobacteraceae bacterium]
MSESQLEAATVKPRLHEPPRIALWLVVGLALLRVGYLGFAELFPEEAYYWNYAKHLDIGYLDHPPMVAWLIHLGTSLFGNNEWGVRLFALLSSLTAGFFAFKLTALLYNRGTAIVALLLLQVLPFFFMTGFMITPDAPLMGCWAGMLYFLARVFLTQSTGAWIGVGICLGLGMLSKYTIALLGPATLLFITLDPPSRIWWRRLAPYGAVLLAIVIFTPVILWNAQHDWASFNFQSVDRAAEPRRFSSHELLASILALLTPIGLFLAGRALIGKPVAKKADEADFEARRRLFTRVFTLVPLAVFVAFSVIHRVKLNWTGPLWLAAIPAMAAGALVLRGSRAFRVGWLLTLILLPLTYAGVLQYLAWGLPGIGYSSKTELLPVGWAQLGRELEFKKSELEKAVPDNVLIVGLDRNFIASEAAFYQSDQQEAVRDTTGAHLFGGKSLMYEFWFPPKKQDGAVLLLVSFNKDDLNRRSIRERSGRLGPIEEIKLERGGKSIRLAYTRVAYKYLSGKTKK